MKFFINFHKLCVFFFVYLFVYAMLSLLFTLFWFWLRFSEGQKWEWSRQSRLTCHLRRLRWRDLRRRLDRRLPVISDPIFFFCRSFSYLSFYFWLNDVNLNFLFSVSNVMSDVWNDWCVKLFEFRILFISLIYLCSSFPLINVWNFFNFSCFPKKARSHELSD